MEYEDRRDADDAYHEMHNKRIGRDDVLKIEVCSLTRLHSALEGNFCPDIFASGLARLPQLLGGLTLVVIAIVVTGPVAVDLRVVGALPPLVAVLATTLPGKTIAVIVTEIGITTVSAATPETALAARILGMRYPPILNLDPLNLS